MLQFIDIKAIQKELGNHFTLDVEVNRRGLLKIIQALTTTGQSLADAKIELEDWEYNCSALIEKLIYHSLSVVKLAEGDELKFLKDNNGIRVIDSTSIIILSRSVLECYLTLHYIFFDSATQAQKKFRFKLWRLAGLQSRQQFKGDHLSLDQKKANEQKLITQLLAEIRTDPNYEKLDKRQLHKLNTYGLARLDSFNDIIKKSNLKQSQFTNMYSYFSSYTHSEYLSILQMQQGTQRIEDAENVNRIATALSFVRLVNCATIFSLKEKFKSVEIVYHTFPIELASTIEVFADIALGRNKAK